MHRWEHLGRIELHLRLLPLLWLGCVKGSARPILRPIISFMISLVPPKIRVTARRPSARDRVLGHVAVAAVQLQAAVDHAALHLRSTRLGDRRLLGRSVPPTQGREAAVEKRLRDLELGVALGELEREFWKEPIG